MLVSDKAEGGNQHPELSSVCTLYLLEVRGVRANREHKQLGSNKTDFTPAKVKEEQALKRPVRWPVPCPHCLSWSGTMPREGRKSGVKGLASP